MTTASMMLYDCWAASRSQRNLCAGGGALATAVLASRVCSLPGGSRRRAGDLDSPRWAVHLRGAAAICATASRATRPVVSAARGARGAPAIYANASGDGGFAAMTVNCGCLYMLHGEWTVAEEALHITTLKLLASTPSGESPSILSSETASCSSQTTWQQLRR